VALTLLLGLLCAAPLRGGEPRDLLKAVRSTHLDATRAVSLNNVELGFGLARLHVRHGTLIPTRPIDERTLEFVLIGHADLKVDPPDQIEAGQLELFTGQRRLDTTIEEAVLVMANQETVRELLDREPQETIGPVTLERATALHDRWLASSERRATGAESGMFRALVGDRAYLNYFALMSSDPDVGEFVLIHDPEDAEQVTLAAYNRLNIRGWDRIRLARHIRFQQRKGRYLGVTLDDLGAWDIWLSAPWTAEGVPTPGTVGFETHHYDLDVKIARKSLRIEGTATLQIEAIDAGRRTLSLELYRDIEVGSVVDGKGRELLAFRSGPEVVVHLAEPTRTGDRLTLRVGFGGQVLKWVGRRTYDLASTDNWYPHCGSIDRATYAIKIEWPRKYELLANGTVLASGQHGKRRWERRSIDRPAIAFSFAMGDFDVTRSRVGHVDLTLGISRDDGTPSPEIHRRTIDVIERSLAFFEEMFGPYPLDEMTVVVLPRGYSQSFLGFITLTKSVADEESLELHDAGKWTREVTISHEIAHQWWGNLIGWWSYRDQWLSEAMANYAGVLFYLSSNDDQRVSVAKLSVGWRATLEQTVDSGRTVESLGPIVLGNRLNSSEAGNGYRAIVYRKGAVVLAMLARAVGEENFQKMLRSLAEAAHGKVITTENFIEAVERMSGLDLQGFAQQYVYGTGIPLVYYDYRFEPDETGDGWRVIGEAHRFHERRYTPRLERRADGSWDVVRDPVTDEFAETTALVVPFELISTVSELEDDFVYSGNHRTMQTSQMMLKGRTRQFEIESRFEPEQFALDPLGEILARFFSARTSPKRYARYRGQDLIARGRYREAESVLLDALNRPPGKLRETPVLPWLKDPVVDCNREDAAIQLALARMYIDLDRDDEAEERMEEVDRLLLEDGDAYRMERDTVWARLNLRSGQYDEAYQRLKKTMRLAAPERQPLRWQARLLRLRLKSERQAMTDAYALLAIASRETGHVEDYEWAMAGARERGVDLTGLQ
jgi:tetratricopeptide (TPR) repeat protein